MTYWKKGLAALTSLLSIACTPTPPRNVQVVEDFKLQQYLGTWYEIARLDHRFERGLERVTATYALRADGGISVVNRGFNPQKARWQESTGKAYFVGAPTRAALKVSFFWPFYGGYNIIALDPAYRYALICGPNRHYLWLLSRTPQLDSNIVQQLVDAARAAQFPVEQLIWVEQMASSI